MKRIITYIPMVFSMPIINTLCVIFFILLSFQKIVYAAEYPDWEGFPPMYTIHGMAEYNDEIFCASKGGLLRYNPATMEYTLYYKNHGLLSNDVWSIAATSEAIYLGFENDGLFRFHPETDEYEPILFPEYVTDTQKLAVRKIFAKNDSILYIGHAKGVDCINIYTKELKTYTNLGKIIPENVPVNDVNVFKGKIWVCTDFGLAVADEDNPNLELASNWKNYQYGGSRYNCIEFIKDQWFERISIGAKWDGILIFNEERDKIEPTNITNLNIYDFAVSMGIGWAATDAGLYRTNISIWSRRDTEYRNLRTIIGRSDSTLWIGTNIHGLQYFTTQGYKDIPAIGGPRNSGFYTIDIAPGNVLWISTATRDQLMDAMILRFDNAVWTEYGAEFGLDRSTVKAVVDNTGIIWLPNWGKGMNVLQDDGTPGTEDDTVVHIDKGMEIFKQTLGAGYVVLPDATIDKNGNIWVVNHQVNETNSGAVVLDGYPITKHQTYSPQEDGLASAEILHIDVDNDGWVWLGTPTNGLMALYVGDDPYDKTDTYVKNFSLSDDLLGMDITAVGHDLDGDIWVGTKGGLNRIKKLSGKQFKVEDVNNLIGGGAVEISCFVVDSSNNKWIGTNGSGLYKLDSNNDLAAHYRPDNSGIFSDTIFSLRYDKAANVLWIGTDKGLNKFHVEGTEQEGKDTTIHVYPNPFEIWGTDSQVTFANLKTNSRVSIYTFGGELVNGLTADTTSSTGEASVVWNGRNFKDETVASGVYFYVGTDSKGRQFKDKMAVIRR